VIFLEIEALLHLKLHPYPTNPERSRDSYSDKT